MAQSQNEERKQWYKAMRKFKWGIIAGIQCAFLAKVIKYYEDTHTADIQPLANSSDGEVSAQYLDIPVSENCYMIDEIIKQLKPELTKIDKKCSSNIVEKLPKKRLMRDGVPVVAVVLDRDNDNWKGGRAVNNYVPNSSRLHNANDAIIIGVLGGDAENG
ncbi:hypothetical protein [Lactobacillus helveticus]|uniref:hypothetical protein n=1 Tax=Lactobacillus helveticus TaxID=1587 RepID=UPI00062AAEFF|nr:hypothetical protein [Lactobacillus helveticus]AKG66655.1 hypothetical protein TU99_04885 [Lactobacillus helveticus]